MRARARESMAPHATARRAEGRARGAEARARGADATARAADAGAGPNGPAGAQSATARSATARFTAARFTAAAMLAGAAALLLAAAPAPLGAQEGEHPGKAVYDRWCSACHGIEGDGQGPAAEWMLPRPRDFTTGLYQIRTTAGGQLPTDDDILHIINVGMPGTTMPGWESTLSRQDRRNLVAYLKTFSRFFQSEEAPPPLDFGRAPRVTPERIAEGRVFYDSIECWSCHGPEGRGDGGSAPTLEDDAGDPIRAVDLTKNWAFNGGGTVEDIYRRLRTGLDGTPMPSFSDLLDAGFMTEDQLWNLAHFVRSLAPETTPRVREVIRAGRLEPDEELPSTPDDERWAEVEAFRVPLVAQIIVKPRWFNPRVEGITVRALHDGEELAMLLTWSDPSRSPDPAWAEWQERVIAAMEPQDEGAAGPGAYPDRVAVQFPVTIPDGMERPFFLMGSQRSPVYLWQWASRQEGRAGPVTSQAIARGMHEIEPLQGRELTGTTRYEDGQWQVLFRRALVTEETTNRLQFASAQAIPVAFFAWDGDNGETGTQGSISSWYYVYLEEATPVTVFVFPFVALALTALLGLLVVARAQKREGAAT